MLSQCSGAPASGQSGLLFPTIVSAPLFMRLHLGCLLVHGTASIIIVFCHISESTLLRICHASGRTSINPNPACFYTKPASNQTRILWLAGDRVTNPVCSCTELVKTQYLHWAIQRKLPKSIKIYPSPLTHPTHP